MGRDQDKKKAIEAGFDAYVIKPGDLDELNQLLVARFPLVERAG